MNDLKEPSITFVCCLEAGPMEEQVILLANSLRTWGGRFSKCPFYAVRPRAGFPLASRTLHALRKLNVKYVSCAPGHKVTWYPYMNKATALAFVETRVETEQVCWLDSDLLFAGEPKDLELKPGEDFAAAPASTVHDIGVDSETARHASYWKAICAAVGLSYDLIPWIPAPVGEGSRMRMYWQGGIFTYRTERRLGAWHKRYVEELIASGLSSKDSGVYFHDQCAHALGVWQAGLRWRVLGEDHNFALNKLRADEVDIRSLKDAKVLHYFGSLWPDSFTQLCFWVNRANPSLGRLLARRGPLRNRRDLLTKAGIRALKTLRQSKLNRYAASCRAA